MISSIYIFYITNVIAVHQGIMFILLKLRRTYCRKKNKGLENESNVYKGLLKVYEKRRNFAYDIQLVLCQDLVQNKMRGSAS